MRGLLVGIAASLALAAPSVHADEPKGKVDVGTVLRALAAPDVPTRRETAAELAGAYPQGTRLIPALIECRRDEHPGVRVAAEATLRAYAERGIVEAAAILAAVAKSKRSPNPELQSARVAMDLGDGLTPVDVAFGTNMVADGWFTPICAAASSAGDVPEMRSLLGWLLDGSVERARSPAAAALALLAGARSAPEGLPQAVVDAEATIAALAPEPSSQDDTDAFGNRLKRVDDAAATRLLAVGLLARSPGGARGVVDVIAVRAGTPDAAWVARELAAWSTPYRAVLRERVTGLANAPFEDLRTLVEAGEVDRVVARLESKSLDERRKAAVALLGSSATARALAVLRSPEAAGECHVRGLPASWVAALGRSPNHANESIPVLEAAWKKRVGLGRPMTREFVAIAWALWRLDPTREKERDFFLDALANGEISPHRSDTGPATEALARVAESGEALASIAPAVLDRLRPRAVALELRPLVDAVAALGPAAAPATPAVVALLRDETERVLAKLNRTVANADLSPRARVAKVLEAGPEFQSAVDPPLVLALVHAIESLGVMSPEVRSSLDALAPIPGDPLRIAVARARRVLTRVPTK